MKITPILNFNNVNAQIKLKKDDELKNKVTNPISSKVPDAADKKLSVDLLKVYSGVIENKKDTNTNISTFDYLKTLPNVKGTFNNELKAVANVIDKKNEDSQYTSKLVDMVADGTLWRGVLRYFTPNTHTAPNIAADMDLMNDADKKGVNVNDLYVPHFSDKENGIKQVKTGDTFEVEGENNIYFKNSENEAEQLKISKELFTKLFPPVERFSCVQGAAGDCYLLSTLNAMMNNPQTRGTIYNMFEETDKNVNIKIPNGEFSYSVPKNDLRQDIDKWQHMQGSTGMVLAEHVYGEELKHRLENKFYSEMNEKIENIKASEPQNIEKLENYKQRIEEFSEKLKDSSFKPVLTRFENPDANGKLTFQYDENGIMFKDLQTANKELRRKLVTPADFYRGAIGGDLDVVMRDFGFKNVTEYKTNNSEQEKSLKKLLFSDKTENYIFTAGALSDGTLVEKPIAKDDSIYGSHAYRIQPFKTENGDTRFYVENPWNTTQNTVINYEKLKEYFEVICAGKVE